MATVIQFSSNDLPPGHCRAYTTDAHIVMVYNLGGEFFATQGVCTHEDLPLAGGRFAENVMECPHHGSRFNIRTGKVLTPPAEMNLPTFPVRVEGGTVTVILSRETSNSKPQSP